MVRLFDKRFKKSSKSSQNIFLGIPTNIAAGSLGFRAELDIGPKGEKDYNWEQIGLIRLGLQMRRTPGLHESCFATRGGMIKNLQSRRPRLLARSLAVVNRTTTSQVSATDPPHRGRSSCGSLSPSRQKRLPATPERKEDHQWRRQVRASANGPLVSC